MPTKKTFLCLANSRRPGGHCVAGIEVTENGFGGWVRPVSKGADRGLSDAQVLCSDNKPVRVLDVVSVGLERHAPKFCHTEDYFVASERWIRRERIVDWSTIESLVDTPDAPLWVDNESTYHGALDKIAEVEAADLSTSLCLVRPRNLVLRVTDDSVYNRDATVRHVRARFSLRGSRRPYALQVTDPSFEIPYKAKPVGDYPVESAIICVSLAEPWNGYTFKLAASIITPDMLA